MKIYTISLPIIFFLGMLGFYFIIKCKDAEIENLNKQIELLECYKENYLIMADSLDGIHNACFRIGK